MQINSAGVKWEEKTVSSLDKLVEYWTYSNLATSPKSGSFQKRQEHFIIRFLQKQIICAVPKNKSFFYFWELQVDYQNLFSSVRSAAIACRVVIETIHKKGDEKHPTRWIRDRTNGGVPCSPWRQSPVNDGDTNSTTANGQVRTT